MANYYAAARSNYFRVKDREAFEAALPCGIGVWEHDTDPQFIAIYDDGLDSSGWPSWAYDEETGEEYEVELPQLISEHLVDGDVAILMEAGAEKLRYVSGYAIAVNSAGEERSVALYDIYGLAKELGDVVTTACY